MAVYVDLIQDHSERGWRFTHFCHMLADTEAELHEMAGALGMPRHIYQEHPYRWHYDLPAHLRPDAIELGAVEVTLREVALLLRRRRQLLVAYGGSR